MGSEEEGKGNMYAVLNSLEEWQDMYVIENHRLIVELEGTPSVIKSNPLQRKNLN